DPVYQSPGQYSTSAVWVAVVAYSLQVYGDFSGYSDIALGTAHMLGFKLPENFNMPYMARNIAEFWRRWHISLSTWLRDYVFIPLGGSKGTYLKTSVTLMVTMALCGLWHGAKWTYVGFGVVQGVMMITQRSFRGWCKVRPKVREMLETRVGTTLRILVTYWTFIVSLVIFRSQDFHRMWMTFHAMFVPQHGIMVRYPVGPWALVCTFFVLLVCHIAGEKKWWNKINIILPTPIRGFAYAVVLELIVTLAPETQKAFIYFQF
ncbi:MAG: MBOAT family O-acyltransferase, partial [Chthoniobacteraceae bacterium]